MVDSLKRAEVEILNSEWFLPSDELQSVGVDNQNKIGWLSNKDNRYGWFIYALNEFELNEFGEGCVRTYSYSTNSTSIIKLNAKTGYFAFINSQHYAETGEVVFDKMTTYKQLIVYDNEKAFDFFELSK